MKVNDGSIAYVGVIVLFRDASCVPVAMELGFCAISG